uniref:Protein kinase domain-containing protein n=1 Tax=Bicosoecida sp. CB-2014 TaxID=1486930 RepID=A0A7S1CJ69_9STRA
MAAAHEEGLTLESSVDAIFRALPADDVAGVTATSNLKTMSQAQFRGLPPYVLHRLFEPEGERGAAVADAILARIALIEDQAEAPFGIDATFVAPRSEEHNDPEFLKQNRIFISMAPSAYAPTSLVMPGIGAPVAADETWTAAVAEGLAKWLRGLTLGGREDEEDTAALEAHLGEYITLATTATASRATVDAAAAREAPAESPVSPAALAKLSRQVSEAIALFDEAACTGGTADHVSIAKVTWGHPTVKQWLGGAAHDEGLAPLASASDAALAAHAAQLACDEARDARQKARATLKADYAAHMLAAYRAFDGWHSGSDTTAGLAETYCSEMLMETYFVAALQDPALRTLAGRKDFQVTRDNEYYLRYKTQFPLVFDVGTAAKPMLVVRQFKPDTCVHQVRAACNLLRLVSDVKSRTANSGAGTAHDVNKCATIVIGFDDVMRQVTKGKASSELAAVPEDRAIRSNAGSGGSSGGDRSGGVRSGGGGGGEGEGESKGATESGSASDSAPYLIDIPITTFDKFGFRVFGVFVSTNREGQKERRVVCVHQSPLPVFRCSADEVHRFVREVITVTWSIRLWIEKTRDTFGQNITDHVAGRLVNTAKRLDVQSSNQRKAAAKKHKVGRKSSASGATTSSGGAASGGVDDGEADRVYDGDMAALTAAGLSRVQTLFMRSQKCYTPRSSSESEAERIVRMYTGTRRDGVQCVAKVVEEPDGSSELDILHDIRDRKVPHVVQVLGSYSILNGTATALLFARAPTTLSSEIAAPVDGERAVQWAQQLLRAVAALHDAGIIHCDIKPGNVLVRDDGDVELADFGSARRVPAASRSHDGGAAGAASARALVEEAFLGDGTPGYMAPERLAALESGGGTVDARVDEYALGVVVGQLAAALSKRSPPSASLSDGGALGRLEALGALLTGPVESRPHARDVLVDEAAWLCEAGDGAAAAASSTS